MSKQAIVAYIPALHQGYLNFFKENQGDVYVISEDLLKNVPRLERDIRAMPARLIKDALDGINIATTIKLLNKANVEDIQKKYDKIVLPDEDVSRQFVEDYFNKVTVSFVPVFLRWDRQISTAETKVNPNRTISNDQLDKEMMIKASKEAEQSPDWWRQVGSVLVRNGEILLTAYNKPLVAKDYSSNIFGDPRSNFDAGEYIELSKAMHSEAFIVAQAAREGISLDGADIYVTTFPCPNCAKLIASSGVKKVYYSVGYSLLDAEDIFKAYDIEIILVQT
ncbi:MAG: deaminase [Candidatus Saccharimonadales bacterium]